MNEKKDGWRDSEMNECVEKRLSKKMDNNTSIDG